MKNLPFDMDIGVQFESWAESLTDIKSVAETAIAQILEILETPKLGELSLAFVSDAKIHVLNRDYRHKDTPTNVLSFPDEGPAPLLGDIVLAFETVTREADEKSISLEHHIAHLLIHGFLHLQGYDHETEADAAEMEALEITALASLNIDNP
ncbi:rRNA maturation RNase YbeY [Hellea balneolensis]|uniref:rRNA maturation RNase YbeY n=1 Tax=Hellea balneolensis TaxID=287478 RepID=UPI0004142214|nr:rRNA maturation RNase YbeY [Hellea balneolensis]